MKCSILFLVLIATLLLASCATPYQPKGFAGGFSETQLSENVFRVTFTANGYSSRERAEDFALLRSADLALDHGFTHFAIVDGRQDTDYGVYTTPTQTQTTGWATGFPRTTTTGGQSFMVRKPSATNTVVLLSGNPEGVPFIYDALFIRDTLASKYELQ